MECARHPDTGAIAACAECGDLVCAACRRVGEDGLGRCPGCSAIDEPDAQVEPEPSELADALVTLEPGVSLAALDSEAPVATEPEPEPVEAEPDTVDDSGLAPIPWEHPERFGDTAAFRMSVTQAVFAPMQFMTRVPWVRGDLQTPLLFAVLCGVLGFMGMTLVGSVFPLPQAPGSTFALGPLGVLPPTVARLVQMPLLPLTLTLVLFMQSGLAHVLLSAVGATRRPFEATFRVFCYAQVASLFLIIPKAGPHVNVMFTVLLVLSGMRAAHATTFATGLLALTPVIIGQLFFPLV